MKSNLFLLDLKPLLKNILIKKIKKTPYSDNGGKYIAFANFLATNEVSHLTTPPHTPEHNGFYERRHLHIVETGLPLLSHASIPLTYWPHAFATTVSSLILCQPQPLIFPFHMKIFSELHLTTPN